MKLSEAIRLGAMLKPQARYYGLTPDGRTCALGAALDAIGCATNNYSDVLNHWPLAGKKAVHPLTGSPMLVMSIVRVLNDEERWSREQIAAWVETLEPPDMPTPEPVIARAMEQETRS